MFGQAYLGSVKQAEIGRDNPKSGPPAWEWAGISRFVQQPMYTKPTTKYEYMGCLVCKSKKQSMEAMENFQNRTHTI